MADVLWCDVSEFQTPVDDSYPYRWLSIRSNDGTYVDRKFQQDYAWCVKRANEGKLDGFFVYAVYEPDNEAWARTLMSVVGTPHPLMAVMVDVESWGGRISGDRSTDINAGVKQLSIWLGDVARVTGYGNAGDLNNLWPNRTLAPNHIVYANYSGNPGYPGAFGHQFTSSANVPPFGHPVDLNSADGYDSGSLQRLLGLASGVAPVPASAHTDFIGAVTVHRPIADIQRLVGANPDGIYGPVTTADVQRWQAAHGLAADGIWGPLSDAQGFPVAPSGALVVDGRLGPRTVTRWQQVMGTTVDGVISTPSELVRAVQTRLNAAHCRDWDGNPLQVDGLGIVQNGVRYRTVYALERYLGTPLDGYLSDPVSEAVKALQARLNVGRF